ncbi:hypothetical protein CTA1_10932 [Colletotrichum tanaceti]|uniref:Uncharacterized protein n=1 Tax=Colletotrichum tanaceti TaxID=1306861 RepID=A0A4U6X0U3_9PEZI|nr:hypothetical protein CTA1_10932 [Colletotrichum tanaceti]
MQAPPGDQITGLVRQDGLPEDGLGRWTNVNPTVSKGAERPGLLCVCVQAGAFRTHCRSRVSSHPPLWRSNCFIVICSVLYSMDFDSQTCR